MHFEGPDPAFNVICRYCLPDDWQVAPSVGRAYDCCAVCRGFEWSYPIDLVRQQFKPLLALYDQLDSSFAHREKADRSGMPLVDALEWDWRLKPQEKVFRVLHACSERDATEADRARFNPAREIPLHDSFTWQTDNGREQKQWDLLKVELVKKNRFFPDPSLLGLLELSFLSCETTIQVGHRFYRSRSQRGSRATFREADMRGPPSGLAPAGRANPSGIPYLYVGSHEQVATAEVRPHVGDLLTVATFEVTKPHRVLDLTATQLAPFHWGARLEKVLPYLGLLTRLGQELSRPVGVHDQARDYLPTQYLCEFAKNLGFEGVAYRTSAMSESSSDPEEMPIDYLDDEPPRELKSNLVMFDVNSLQFVESKTVQVTRVEIVARDYPSVPDED